MIFKHSKSGLENIEYKVNSYNHPFEEHQHKLLIVNVAISIHIRLLDHFLTIVANIDQSIIVTILTNIKQNLLS